MGIQATTLPSDSTSDDSKFDPAEQESFDDADDVVFVKDDAASDEAHQPEAKATSEKSKKASDRKSDEEEDSRNEWRSRAVIATAFLGLMFLITAAHEVLTPPLESPQQFVEKNPSPVKIEPFGLTSR